jgi:hypothetical protein
VQFLLAPLTVPPDLFLPRLFVLLLVLWTSNSEIDVLLLPTLSPLSYTTASTYLPVIPATIANSVLNFWPNLILYFNIHVLHFHFSFLLLILFVILILIVILFCTVLLILQLFLLTLLTLLTLLLFWFGFWPGPTARRLWAASIADRSGAFHNCNTYRVFRHIHTPTDSRVCWWTKVPGA